MAKGEKNQGVAVFTRNHLSHLERAVRLSAEKPNAPIVFRSGARWSSARDALDGRHPVPVYIAPIDRGGSVEYVAELSEVHLDPRRSDTRVAELLREEEVTNPNEGLWDESGGVQTLYVLRNCRRLAAGFAMTDLIKVSDGTALSEDYGYSYSIVLARPVEEAETEPSAAPAPGNG